MTTDADGWVEHDGKGMPVAPSSPAIIGYANPTNLNDETFTVRKTAAGLYTLPVYADAMMAERSKK